MNGTEVEMAVARSICNHSTHARKNGAGPASRLRDDLKMNSLALVALVTDLCEELSIGIVSFNETDLTGLGTVQDVSDLFLRKSAVSRQGTEA